MADNRVFATLLKSLRENDFGDLDVGASPRWRHDLLVEIPAMFSSDATVFGRLPAGFRWVRDLGREERQGWLTALGDAARGEVARRSSQQTYARMFVSATTSIAGVLVKGFAAKLDPAWTKSDRQRQALVRRHANMTPKALLHSLVETYVKECVPGIHFAYSQEQLWNMGDSELPRGRSRGCILVRGPPVADPDSIVILTRASRKDPTAPKWASIVGGHRMPTIYPEPAAMAAPMAAPVAAPTPAVAPVMAAPATCIPYAPVTSMAPPAPYYSSSDAWYPGMGSASGSVQADWGPSDRLLDSVLGTQSCAMASLRDSRSTLVGSAPRPISHTAAFPEPARPAPVEFEFDTPVAITIRMRGPDGATVEKRVGPGRVTLDSAFASASSSDAVASTALPVEETGEAAALADAATMSVGGEWMEGYEDLFSDEHAIVDAINHLQAM